jgi:FMN phosphatase YigB (HAD superfamily)
VALSEARANVHRVSFREHDQQASPSLRDPPAERPERRRQPGARGMTARDPVVFLVDVDNTLLDNDGLQEDLRGHLERELGAERRDRYWEILIDLFAEFGYRDYIGALQKLRAENPSDQRLLSVSGFLLDYPFADRLYPGALDVVRRLGRWGRTVILTDGDVVFQPRKVERSGIFKVADGHVLIYIHKEQALDDVERRYPAAHYVLVDDKPRILAAVKAAWGERVTTVLPRQGQFALDQKVLAALPPPDIAIERIGDLLAYDLPGLVPDLSAFTSRLEAAR